MLGIRRLGRGKVFKSGGAFLEVGGWDVCGWLVERVEGDFGMSVGGVYG